jgi:NAD(P)-dependent dehydrogenase (short-subunit alcohol dehydrogenase family)
MSTTSQSNLAGQRALVTGGTSGIGRAVALQLARDGAEVVVHGRDAARGAETVEEITGAGGKTSFVAADLGDTADVQRLAREVGDIDILINNAGISLFAPTAEFEVAEFDKMFASNVRAPFFLVAAFAPGMAARGHGSIVSVSSMAGGVGLVGGRRVWRDEGVARGDDACVGGGVQPERRTRQHHRSGPRLHPDTVRAGVHRCARGNDADAPCLTARGDRRGRRVSRLAASELHHRHHGRRRRRPESGLARTRQQRSQPWAVSRNRCRK